MPDLNLGDVREIDEEWAREYFTQDVRERTPIGAGEARNAVPADVGGQAE
ncbi:hypothetical protein ACFZDJ_35545 [Streptomyces sp. NPDC007896]